MHSGHRESSLVLQSPEVHESSSGDTREGICEISGKKGKERNTSA